MQSPCWSLFVGSTREIGSALTRLCLRHRSIDTKLKTFARYSRLLLVFSPGLIVLHRGVCQTNEQEVKDLTPSLYMDA